MESLLVDPDEVHEYGSTENSSNTAAFGNDPSRLMSYFLNAVQNTSVALLASSCSFNLLSSLRSIGARHGDPLHSRG